MTAPKITGTRSAASLRDPAVAGAIGFGAFALLHFHDPHNSGAYGFCPFLAVTGRPCAGCGGLRAVNDLTRGDFIGAISSNVLVVVLVGVLAVAWVLWVVRRLGGQDGRMIVVGPKVGIAILVALTVFGVIRNTPWGAWLAP